MSGWPPPLRLSFIRALAGDGMLDLNMQALDTVPVKVEPKTLEMTGLYSAPAGTAPTGAVGQPLNET